MQQVVDSTSKLMSSAINSGGDTGEGRSPRDPDTNEPRDFKLNDSLGEAVVGRTDSDMYIHEAGYINHFTTNGYPAPSVTTVSGNYPEPNYRANMSMNVNASSPGTSWLRYYYTKNRLNLVSSSITGVSGAGWTATITGVGTVVKTTNGVTTTIPGCTFTARVTEGGPDAIGIEIRKPDGMLYYSDGSRTVSGRNYTTMCGLP